LVHGHKLHSGTPAGKDKLGTPKETLASPASKEFQEVHASPERRETPLKGRDSPMRDVNKGGSTSTPINNSAAPELDTILADLDSSEWRTRYFILYLYL
jgi:hypothetical protein